MNGQPTPGAGSTHVAIDPSGKWLLVCNEKSSNVVEFAIYPQSGALKESGVAANVPTAMCAKFLEQ